MFGSMIGVRLRLKGLGERREEGEKGGGRRAPGLALME